MREISVKSLSHEIQSGQINQRFSKRILVPEKISMKRLENLILPPFWNMPKEREFSIIKFGMSTNSSYAKRIKQTMQSRIKQDILHNTFRIGGHYYGISYRKNFPRSDNHMGDMYPHTGSLSRK